MNVQEQCVDNYGILQTDENHCKQYVDNKKEDKKKEWVRTDTKHLQI